MIEILIILIGLIFGSFANVCIYRLPKNKQVISGRSFCPKCKKSGLVTPAEQKQFGLKIGTIVSRPNGCMSCYQTGYKGRIVLTELLELNDNIRDYINNSRKTSSMDCSLLPEETLANAARAHIESGETSIEEFLSIMGSLD